MFPTRRTSQILQRASGALVLLRSFLLLEYDNAVDWEVDQEPAQPFEHPHRAPLRGAGAGGPLRARRPGATQPRAQVCISPVERLATGAVGQPRRTLRRARTHS